MGSVTRKHKANIGAGIVIGMFLCLIISPLAYSLEIHSEHFFLGMPFDSSGADDIIFRNLYVLSNNSTTRFANWVAYRLSPQETYGNLDLNRIWRTDPFLDDDETMRANPDDYTGAFATYSYQRGHLAPLAAFKGSVHASEVNFYSNITPQTQAFNNGPWKDLEAAVREIVLQGEVVHVITGPYYDPDISMPPLPSAHIEHTVPDGYWKIVCLGTEPKPDISAFLIPHIGFESDDFRDYAVAVDEIESQTGLDFFGVLDDAQERGMERSVNISEPLQK